MADFQVVWEHLALKKIIVLLNQENKIAKMSVSNTSFHNATTFKKSYKHSRNTSKAIMKKQIRFVIF